MKVLYDYAVFNQQRFGGVSKCFCELIRHRPEGEEYVVGVKQSDNVHLVETHLVEGLKPARCDGDKFMKRFGKSFISRKAYAVLKRLPYSPVAERVNKDYSLSLIKRGDYDVLHVTSITGTYFLSSLGSKPFVYTVHDLIQERFPHYFKSHNKVTDCKRLLCDKAVAVIAVSEQTKRDLMEILNIPEKKIKVVYHGGPIPMKVKERAIVDGPYFLYVGQRWLYKNFIKTLEDFAIFARKHEEVKLVCTANPFTKAEMEKITALGIGDHVLQMCVGEQELRNLYTHAVAFIYPSLYEGFGMPTLEAFAQGCPCLLNENSCFPEVGGDAAFYFHSDGVSSDLPDLLEHVYSLNATERTAVVKKGYEQLAKFSWTEASKKLWDVYHESVGKDTDIHHIIGGGKNLIHTLRPTLSAHVELQKVAA